MPSFAAPDEARSSPVTLGLIGFGALAHRVIAGFGPGEVEWVILVRTDRPLAQSAENVRLVTRIEELVAARPRAVVEVATQDAAADCVPRLLEAGIPVVLASIGALADPELCLRLDAARNASGAPLVLPAGSVGGLDYLGAVARLEDAEIRYTSRKPVAAWASELERLGVTAPSTEVVLFEGAPEEAARRFPKNLNAALAISLAVRPRSLTVRVVADPEADGNTHEIEAASSAGTAFMRFVNTPSPDNPKTSAITALSLLSALETVLDSRRNG